MPQHSLQPGRKIPLPRQRQIYNGTYYEYFSPPIEFITPATPPSHAFRRCVISRYFEMHFLSPARGLTLLPTFTASSFVMSRSALFSKAAARLCFPQHKYSLPLDYMILLHISILSCL